MSDVSKDVLKQKIHIILDGADLTVLSAKKVRLELEKILGCELLSRKKEIDAIVMNFINSQEDDDDESWDGEEDSEDEPQSRKRTSHANSKKSSPPKKIKKENDSEDESGSVKSEESDFKPAKKSAPAKKKKGGRKRGSGSDNDSDSDYVKPKAAPRKAASGAKGKGNGFTRPLALSPELAELMGADTLPRHEVVKKMWSIIKEKNLYCPKNKQFAICDEALYKVMGVKRFRTFGMLKYLKSHFVN